MTGDMKQGKYSCYLCTGYEGQMPEAVCKELAVRKKKAPTKNSSTGEKRGGREKWYCMVDSLRTSLAQSGQISEFDLDEVGALIELAE